MVRFRRLFEKGVPNLQAVKRESRGAFVVLEIFLHWQPWRDHVSRGRIARDYLTAISKRMPFRLGRGIVGGGEKMVFAAGGKTRSSHWKEGCIFAKSPCGWHSDEVGAAASESYDI